MGKEGPCCHCGVTSTPLWRNGPPEKPVLCNACGSRWRTKGTLKNYMPLHAKIDPDEYEDNRAIRVKSTSLKKNDEPINRKRLYYESEGFQKNLDEETSNRSSSGSAISNSESCAQFGGTDASELTGPTQSIVWDALVPSRKRTCITHPKQSSVEKLTKDLYAILHEQSSLFSDYHEDELLIESEMPLVSVEIGHGSVLIRHPSSIAQEEESESSSLSRVDEGYSNDTKGVSSSCSRVERGKKLNGQVMCLEQIKRERANPEKLPTLWTHNSSLSHFDLSEHLEKEDPDFTPSNLFAIRSDHGALIHGPFQFKDENSDHDLLIDIPSNGSFPQAEFLKPTSVSRLSGMYH